MSDLSLDDWLAMLATRGKSNALGMKGTTQANLLRPCQRLMCQHKETSACPHPGHMHVQSRKRALQGRRPCRRTSGLKIFKHRVWGLMLTSEYKHIEYACDAVPNAHYFVNICPCQCKNEESASTTCADTTRNPPARIRVVRMWNDFY